MVTIEPKWARWLREWPLGLAKQSSFHTFSLAYIGTSIGAALAGVNSASLRIAVAVYTPLIILMIVAALVTRYYRYASPREPLETPQQTWLRERMIEMRYAPMKALLVRMLVWMVLTIALLADGLFASNVVTLVIGYVSLLLPIPLLAYGMILYNRVMRYELYRKYAARVTGLS